MSEQLTLPGVQRALDLEPLLRGALLEAMAAVLMRQEVDWQLCAAPWAFCPRCGELVPNEHWGDGKWLRCRRCVSRAVQHLQPPERPAP